MRNFLCLHRGTDVAPVMNALMLNEHLWNEHRYRTSYKGTPHVDVDDIWLRFSDDSKVADPAELRKVINDDRPVWYPAASILPVKPIVFGLMQRVGAYELGRLLITRVRPGGRILPHADKEGSYVHQGDIARYHVVLQGLPGSLFRCGDETVNMQTGEIWLFNAHKVHEVQNNSADDRIHMLVDVRLWR